MLFKQFIKISKIQLICYLKMTFWEYFIILFYKNINMSLLYTLKKYFILHHSIYINVKSSKLHQIKPLYRHKKIINIDNLKLIFIFFCSKLHLKKNIDYCIEN